MNPQQWPGAKWWKFDFHTHTPASQDTSAWQAAKGTPDAVTPEKWLLKFMEAGLDCVAVTDHNSGQWIDDLKAANERLRQSDPKPVGYRDITIFPGVELSVCGGLHVLAIFDPQTPGSTITSLLGSVGFPATLYGSTDDTNTAACTRSSFAEVVEKIREHGGIVIPAHVDNGKGLLQFNPQSNPSTLHADEIRLAFELEVDAIEVRNRAAPRPPLFMNKSPNWAEVVGSDCHSFRDAAKPGSAFTWIKMASPTLEGLRLALHDGNGISVRRFDDLDAASFDPLKVPSVYIVSVQVGNMQVMGNGQPLDLKFNPFFNALIGGRGTGKSTLIHALRLVFRREKDIQSLLSTSSARQTFERFAKVPRSKNDRDGGGLRANSAISAVVLREGIYYALTWNQDGTGTSVQEWIDGAWQASTSQIIDAQRFPIRLFSQGQIADLAGENQQALLDIIDAAAGVGPLYEAWQEAIRSYLAQRAKIREYDGRLANREGLQVQLDDIGRKLAKLEGSDHATILKRFQVSKQQDHEVTHTFNAADDLKGSIAHLATRLTLDDLRLGVFDEQADADVLAEVAALRQAMATAQTAVNAATEQLTQRIESIRNNPGMNAWRARLTEARLAYEKLQADLALEGITDLSIYGQLVQQRQGLQVQLQQLDALAQEKASLIAKAEAQLQGVHAARANMTQARSDFLATKLTNNLYVDISVIPGGEDIVAAERRLRELIDVMDTRFASDIYQAELGKPEEAVGLLADWERAPNRRTAEAAVRHALVQAAKGQRTVGGALCNNLSARAERDQAFVDRLQCLSFEDGLQVKVSRKGDGKDFQPIFQASAGQRSAAMLAFLLSYGDEPIILDQPEDDLDNHMIYSLIVQQIRANKQRRQLIVVTHNPNIVVNGDAELVHALDFLNCQCRVIQSGALQESSVRTEVCHVMEGGQEAFRRRWQRLGEMR